MIPILSRKRFGWVVCAFSVMLAGLNATPASAQSEKFLPGDKRDRDAPQKDTKPTPEQLDEMQAVYNQCRQRFHSQYLDCRCIAVKFLDQRMKNGPEASQNILLDEVYASCPDTAAVAGKAYNRCLNWASMTRRDFRQFCECYANEYAEIFGEHTTLRPLAQQNMMSHALDECGYTEPMNRRARQQRAIGAQDGPDSEIDMLFGDNDAR